MRDSTAGSIRMAGVVAAVLSLVVCTALLTHVFSTSRESASRLHRMERVLSHVATGMDNVQALRVLQEQNSETMQANLQEIAKALLALERSHADGDEALRTAMLQLARRRGGGGSSGSGSGNADSDAMELDVSSAEYDGHAEGDAPWNGEGGGHGLEFYALTYASHGGSDDYFCRSLRTALHHGVPIRLLGWNSRNTQLVRKALSALDEVLEIERHNPAAVILFHDSFDVLYAGSATDIATRFAEMRVGFLIAAERGCAPYTDGRPTGNDVCEKLYPPSPTPYRWLNSGVWIARARVARRVLQAALAYGVKMQEVTYPLLGGQIPGTQWPVVPISRQNDQEMFAQVFLDGNRENMTLDYRAQLLQCMHLSEGEVELVPGARPRNRLTNSSPLLLHFNGGSKGSFRQSEEILMGGAHVRIPGDTVVRVEGGKPALKYRDVCASYPDLWTP